MHLETSSFNHVRNNSEQSPCRDGEQKEMQQLREALEEMGNKLDVSIKEGSLLRDKIVNLEQKMKDVKLINEIRNNDKKTKYYTGLSSWELFQIIFQLILPAIEHCSTLTKKSISYEEQFLLVLMRLRLNLGEQDLAYRFKISVGTVSNYFRKWIDVLYVRLARNFMVWPTDAANELSMPSYFKRKFPKCKVIIDCFEVPIERYKNLLARSSTYSYYKGKNTVKFMIGISPSGAITYISQGYGGRSTDVHITLDKKHLAVVNDESFCNLLKPGDEVLADRGFLIKKSIEERGATLTTPAFLGKRSRLTRRETSFSRKVSNIRIHVERVIGRLRETYKITKDVVEIQLLRKGDLKLSLFDKIVFVCCCLTNANPSVVPSH